MSIHLIARAVSFLGAIRAGEMKRALELDSSALGCARWKLQVAEILQAL